MTTQTTSNISEQQAHNAVLFICSQTPPGGWVMRQPPSNPLPGTVVRYRVVNLSPVTVAPHRQVVAEGDTWAEVLEQLAGGAA